MFTLYVDNEYTAFELHKAAEKMGFRMEFQWVKKKKKMLIACDFFQVK